MVNEFFSSELVTFLRNIMFKIETPDNNVHQVGTKKLSALPIDVTKTSRAPPAPSLASASVANPSLHCTCCTAREVAVSRCCTCHHLLCASCNTAHVLMRCFESHKVVSLEETRASEVGKLAMECEMHSGENVVYYCGTCQTPACAECAREHSVAAGHQCEGILGEGTVNIKIKLLLLRLCDVEPTHSSW